MTETGEAVYIDVLNESQDRVHADKEDGHDGFPYIHHRKQSIYTFRSTHDPVFQSTLPISVPVDAFLPTMSRPLSVNFQTAARRLSLPHPASLPLKPESELQVSPSPEDFEHKECVQSATVAHESQSSCNMKAEPWQTITTLSHARLVRALASSSFPQQSGYALLACDAIRKDKRIPRVSAARINVILPKHLQQEKVHYIRLMNLVSTHMHSVPPVCQ